MLPKVVKEGSGYMMSDLSDIVRSSSLMPTFLPQLEIPGQKNKDKFPFVNRNQREDTLMNHHLASFIA